MGSIQIPYRHFLLLPLFLILAALYSQVSAFTTDFPILDRPTEFLSEERVFQLFQEWKQRHGKVYKNEKEEEMRLDKFKRNVKYIVEKNSKKKSDSDHFVGLTKFADMSNEEFRQVHTSNIKIPFNKRKTIQMRSVERKPSTASCDVPPSKDWRKHGAVTEVKNQDQCGACWAFSACGAMEGINAIATGELISLSEQELINCDNSYNTGCDGGLMDPAFEWVMNNSGINSEADYPYTASQGRCNYDKVNHKVVIIDGYQDVPEDENALLCAVGQQPVSVGIDGSSLDFQLYRGGIYDGECSSNPDDLSHAVVIVGYGSEGDDDYWIIKNSWGTSWGMEGYAYIRRNTYLPYGVCAINSLASYPTKEASSAPSPYPSPAVPPPPPPSPPPPPPPSPKPSECGEFYYCPEDQTCCCELYFFGICFIQGCCPYENGVCCHGSEFCCPADYPICDVYEGLCLKDYRDNIGVAARKRRMAKHKLPWRANTEATEERDQTLKWKRNHVAAMR
ncbi:low-temperature-induced cysteine proteinase-like precursor [Nicotiana tabacum]|uniref:Cysteine protease CP14 n=1 Tax=Nicotiana tabacum TaxID=4097 RepID=T2BRA8_TOBAC|nr:low-temperature-induced cysteine proteinase-like precursor [Nicotiana tabacum]AGV15822.1 cysteine protease CP14 [Nicotiana tabacum]